MKTHPAILCVLAVSHLAYGQVPSATDAKVLDLLEKRCSECHSDGDEDPHLSKSTDLAKLLGNADYVNQKDPKAGELLRRVLLPAESKKRMPQSKGEKGDKKYREPLTADEVALLTAWSSGKPVEAAATATTPVAADVPAKSATATPAAPAAPVALKPAELASKVTDLFKLRCAECHDQAGSGRAKGNFGYVLDLARIRNDKRFVRLDSPQTSPIYTKLLDGDPEVRMPYLTKADKEKGLAVAPILSGDETSLVLQWLTAGAPDLGTPPDDKKTEKIEETLAKTEPAKPAPDKPGSSVPPPPPPIADRPIIKEKDAMSALFADIQSIEERDRKLIRYISILPQHNNNTEIKDAQLQVVRSGVRKLLNSLSTNPRICKPVEVGPGNVFFRFRLDDLGWDANLWEQIVSFYPYALRDSSLGNEAGTDVPVLRADWLSANGTRPPLYDKILKLPRTQQELEHELGVNVLANLKNFQAVRAGFAHSGISRFNRMIERHDLGNRPGYYWLSYDFAGDEGKRNLLQNPLGPPAAHLGSSSSRTFDHDGGEIIFSLPNGFQGYLLTTAAGQKLEIAPTAIVGDQNGVTGRPDVVNGLSCMICHSSGMKEQPGNGNRSTTDLVRAVAKKGFTASEEEAILALYRDQKEIDEVIKKDRESFLSAMKLAGVEPSTDEPIGFLAKPFEDKMTTERAAAELGFSAEDLVKEMEEREGFGIVKIALGQGALTRGAFGEQFPELAERLRVGKFRKATAISNGSVDVLRTESEKKQPKPLLFEIKTDRQQYKGGEPVQIAVFAETQGHLRLFYKDAKGKVYTLFPTEKQFADAKKLGATINDVIPSQKTVLVSGQRSITGITIFIQKKDEANDQGVRDAVFGREQLGAVVTDIPIEDDAELRAEIEKSGSIEVAVSKMAQTVTKSAITKINASGATSGEVVKPRIGLQLLTIETKPD